MVTAFVISIGTPYNNDSTAVLKDYFDYHKINSFFLTADNTANNYKGAHPSWIKLLSHLYYPTDDFILCWDLDLLPVSREKSIFNVLDLNKLNMCPDTSILLGCNPYNENFKFNGGLCGIPTRYRDFMENVYKTYAPGDRPSFEQYYLNDEIVKQNIEVNELNTNWNSLYPCSDKPNNYFNNAFNKHYTWGADHEKKVKLIKEHRDNYFSKIASAGR